MCQKPLTGYPTKSGRQECSAGKQNGPTVTESRARRLAESSQDRPAALEGQLDRLLLAGQRWLPGRRIRADKLLDGPHALFARAIGSGLCDVEVVRGFVADASLLTHLASVAARRRRLAANRGYALNALHLPE